MRNPLGFALAMIFGAQTASGDAIVRTQAMFATTIAEYFIEHAVTLIWQGRRSPTACRCF